MGINRVFLVGMLIATATPSTATADVRSGFDKWERGDFAGAIAEWRPLAIAGDAEAQYNLGQAYRLGRGVPVDLQQAELWYGKAALQGNLQARDNYGLLLFQNGKRTEAMTYIKESAERGEPRAQYVLGTALFNGDGMAKDWVRGYALMTRSSASGLPAASASLAQMDKYVPLDQRQRGLAMARTMEARAGRPQLASNTVMPPPRTIRREEVPPSRPAARAPEVREPPVVVATRPVRPPRPQTPVAVGGRWRVQLGAFGDASKVDALWTSLQRRIGALAPYRSFVVRAGSVTRLQAGPLPSSAAAEALCRSVRAGGQACLAIAS